MIDALYPQLTGFLTYGLGVLDDAPPEVIPDIRVALAAQLQSDPTIAARTADRVRPGIRPQGAKVPAITYRVLSTRTQHALSGPVGYAESRVQITCWARTIADAVFLKQRVTAIFDGVSGYWSGLYVASCRQDDDGDEDEWAIDGSDVPYFSEVCRYVIRHRSPIASP